MVNNIINLKEAKDNVSYEIVDFIKDLTFYEKERLIAYGLIPFTELKVVKKSFFKQTFLINIRDSKLILSDKDVSKIIIKEK